MLSQLISAVEERSCYQPDRSSRAYSYANRIAQSLYLTKDHTEVVSLAAVLCNLGKMAVPEEVLKSLIPSRRRTASISIRCRMPEPGF